MSVKIYPLEISQESRIEEEQEVAVGPGRGSWMQENPTNKPIVISRIELHGPNNPRLVRVQNGINLVFLPYAMSCESMIWLPYMQLFIEVQVDWTPALVKMVDLVLYIKDHNKTTYNRE